MAKADAVLLGSRWEGLPNVVLEALAIGKIVVATADCGGLVEIQKLKSEGLIIAKSDKILFQLLIKLRSKRKQKRPEKTIQMEMLYPPQIYQHSLKRKVVKLYKEAIIGIA